MWAALGIYARVGQPQTFHGPSTDQVFRYNFFGILGPHVAVPHSFGVNHHGGSVLALVQASGLVDAHLSAKPGLS